MSLPDDVVLVDERWNHVKFPRHVDGSKQRLRSVVATLQAK